MERIKHASVNKAWALNNMAFFEDLFFNKFCDEINFEN